MKKDRQGMIRTSRPLEIRWFSGSGAGGQHRNKHQNCCEVSDPETGLSAKGQSSRSREQNKREACEALKQKLLAHYSREKHRRDSNIVVRTVHMARNEAIDHRTGDKQKPSDVLNGKLIITSQESTTKSGRV